MKRALVVALLILGVAGHAFATTVSLSPQPKVQYFDNNGDPLAGGKVCTYVTGSNTPSPTYTDYTGMTQNANPVQLDSAGRAQIWFDSTVTYRVVLRTAGTTSTCADGTVLWTVDGIHSAGVLSVGNLPPIFTSSVSGGAITFTLSNAAAHTFLGNCTGSAAAPTYCAAGSDKQITFNNSGGMVGSTDLLWDDTTKIFSIRTSGSSVLRLSSDSGAGKILFGTGSQPFIEDHSGSGWSFTSANAQDKIFGSASDDHDYVMAASGGGAGYARGTFAMGTGSAAGDLFLNDANQSAGVRAGAHIIAGSLATPETFVSATTGSLYITTNGGAMATLWVKESSPTATTGWVAK